MSDFLLLIWLFLLCTDWEVLKNTTCIVLNAGNLYMNNFNSYYKLIQSVEIGCMNIFRPCNNFTLHSTDKLKPQQIIF